MKRLLILICFLAISLPGLQAEEYHQIVAERGDYIYALLRKYQLDRHSCNLEQFYALNKLDRDAHLVAGERYYLPIVVYRFNGKTIRSSIGIYDWDKAVRIQQYNEDMLTSQLREQSYKDDRVLWVPYHELQCPDPDLNIPEPVRGEKPTHGKENHFPIFGPDYARVPQVSQAFAGEVYYVVSGHGGPDPGAMTNYHRHSLCEDEYAYDVALRLCRELVSHGATAYMITRDMNDGIRNDLYLDCDTDEQLWGSRAIPTRQKTRLAQRSGVINFLYEQNLASGVPASKQKVIVIHVDSRYKGERVDLFFYFQEGSVESKKLAYNLHNTIKSKYNQHQKGRGYQGSVSSRDLHMLRECTPTTVYIELANIQNRADLKRILLQENRQALANWLREGLNK